MPYHLATPAQATAILPQSRIGRKVGDFPIQTSQKAKDEPPNEGVFGVDSWHLAIKPENSSIDTAQMFGYISQKLEQLFFLD